MTQLASKIFSTYSTILYLSKEEILQVGYNTNDSRPIPSFDQESLVALCSQAQEIFAKEDIILKIDGDVIVVGDIHGSLHDLLRILNYNNINHYKILFLGDYVDRGNFSLECISLLFALKILFPDNFFLIRGNHEFDSVCSQYGFKKEIVHISVPTGLSMQQFPKYSPDESSPQMNVKSDLTLPTFKGDSFQSYTPNYQNYEYDESLYNSFMKAFSYLPICAIINNTSICIHGGISPQLHTIDDIRNSIQRPIDNIDDNQLLCDLLWSDPSKMPAAISLPFEDNPRGRGKLFSNVSISDFLRANFLKRLIRGHECVKNGIEKRFDDKCITVFSASSYDKEMGNKSSILKVLQNDDKIEAITFSAILKLSRWSANFFNAKPYFLMIPDMRNINDENNEVENIQQPSSTKLRNPNSCPVVSGNRMSQRLIHKQLRNVTGSFAMNIGARRKRVNSGSFVNKNLKGLKIPCKLMCQSDDHAHIKMSNMGLAGDDQKVQSNETNTLPKLISKS